MATDRIVALYGCHHRADGLEVQEDRRVVEEIVVLFFELFPAFMLIVCICAGIWLAVTDRQARQEPVVETTADLHGRAPDVEVKEQAGFVQQ